MDGIEPCIELRRKPSPHEIASFICLRAREAVGGHRLGSPGRGERRRGGRLVGLVRGRFQPVFMARAVTSTRHIRSHASEITNVSRRARQLFLLASRCPSGSAPNHRRAGVAPHLQTRNVNRAKRPGLASWRSLCETTQRLREAAPAEVERAMRAAEAVKVHSGL